MRVAILSCFPGCVYGLKAMEKAMRMVARDKGGILQRQPLRSWKD